MRRRSTRVKLAHLFTEGTSAGTNQEVVMMKGWNQWTRKRDGWVERKRRFQKMFAESVRSATREQVPQVPAVVSATDSQTSATVRIRGEQ